MIGSLSNASHIQKSRANVRYVKVTFNDDEKTFDDYTCNFLPRESHNLLTFAFGILDHLNLSSHYFLQSLLSVC